MEDKRDTKILTVAGKGGVGKTSISSAMVRILTEEYPDARILAIDADPAIGLTTALGVEPTDTLDGFSFLAIGRPEAAGCYCKVNAYLKEVISLLANDFDYVIIDGEAGIEQINRRVMEKVTHLFLITDPSRKGCKVVDTIKEVADELVMYDKCGVIVNRVKEEQIPLIKIESAEVLAYIPDDRTHAENDIMGVSVFDLPEDSPVMVGTREALRKMQLI